jgi:hypothetical protein
MAQQLRAEVFEKISEHLARYPDRKFSAKDLARMLHRQGMRATDTWLRKLLPIMEANGLVRRHDAHHQGLVSSMWQAPQA